MIAIFVPFLKEGQAVFTWNAGPLSLAVSHEGVEMLITILLKAWLAALALVWLSGTTRLPDLLHAMRRLGVPAVLVMTMSFMLRYIVVIAEEARNMKLARDLRGGSLTRLREIKSLGSIIGTLFIRSYERSERVYAAMLSRGFDGDFRFTTSTGLRRTDIAFAGVFLLAALVVTAVNFLVSVP
jgi:cobalt/nickel transport system permease protein